MEFVDSWLWLIFVAAGLLMILLELVVGVETGLDMAILGTVFVIGGAATVPFNSWLVTLVVTIIISMLYLLLGRRYVQLRMRTQTVKTNIDAIIGEKGVVQQRIGRNTTGLVKVGNEEWRASSEEDVDEGEEIVVTGVRGVTLIVKK